jgi:Spy/CpxP family protein refolding chaperone
MTYLRLLLISALAASVLCAQEGGGGGGGMGGGGGRGGGGGASVPEVPRGGMATPLERMTKACDLSKDQAKQFSTILNAASKSVAAIREEIPNDRKQLAAAILAGKSADEIKKLEEASGLAAAQMTQAEMKTFGDLYKLLDPDQRHKGDSTVFNMLPGMLMKKNWNE